MLNLTYDQTVEQDHYRGNFLSADGHFGLRGLLRHHKLILESGYEHQVGNYFFSSRIPFPRGYTAVVGPNLMKVSATYGLPLFYPDWGSRPGPLYKKDIREYLLRLRQSSREALSLNRDRVRFRLQHLPFLANL
jgi:hypothetical protein